MGVGTFRRGEPQRIRIAESRLFALIFPSSHLCSVILSFLISFFVSISNLPFSHLSNLCSAILSISHPHLSFSHLLIFSSSHLLIFISSSQPPILPSSQPLFCHSLISFFVSISSSPHHPCPIPITHPPPQLPPHPSPLT